eukprot:gb/GECG01008618.1/.p1 GENE.gb/GECG01008618.1/~~gb/GECG01008618.1/.p1  ORF type:complete len:398 (+),score=24.96 gb/GECG01008618.1/:1-1194(+)
MDTENRTRGSQSQLTMLENFKEYRCRVLRNFMFRLSLRFIVAWMVYLALALVPVMIDKNTAPLLPYLYATKSVLTILVLTVAVVTGVRYFEKAHSALLATIFGVMMIGHFSEGVIVDIIVRQQNLYGAEADSAGIVVASRVLGPHQLLFLVSVVASSRLLVRDVKQYLRLLLIAPSVCGLLVLLQGVAVGGGVSYVGLGIADYLRSVIIVATSIFVNYNISLLEAEGEWKLWVQRKRLQLGCIQAEALLKLVMPRETAHDQLRGTLTRKTYCEATVGFIYLCGYSSLMKTTQGKERMELVQFLDFLIGQLDQLIVEYPEVFKVESIGNCYMVSSGAPFVCRALFPLLHPNSGSYVRNYRYRIAMRKELWSSSWRCSGCTLNYKFTARRNARKSFLGN